MNNISYYLLLLAILALSFRQENWWPAILVVLSFLASLSFHPLELPPEPEIPTVSQPTRPVIDLDKLSQAMEMMVTCYHRGESYSRRAICAQGVEQRYWNLSQAILVQSGLRAPNSPNWNSQGSALDDMRFIRSVTKVDEYSVTVRESQSILGRLIS